MKRTFTALVLASVMSLSLYGCDATDGGDYATANFTFTVPETLRLLEYDESQYSGKRYTFCDVDDEERIIEICEAAQANCTPAAIYMGDGNVFDEGTEEIPNTPLPTYRCISKNADDDSAYMSAAVGCEGKLLHMIAELPQTDTNWFLLAIEEIAYTVAYHGESLQAGEAENEWFTVSYSEQWTQFERLDAEEEEPKLYLIDSLAENHCEQTVGFLVYAMPDETRSPKEMVENLLAADSRYRQNETICETTMFGHQGWQYSYLLGEDETELTAHSMRWTVFYFEVQGKRYNISYFGCRELHDQLLADFENEITLTLK